MATEPSRTIRIELATPPPRGYDVVVGAGVLDRLGTLLPTGADAERYGLVCDEVVASLHGTRVRAALVAAGRTTDLFIIPAGEAEKTRERWAALTDALIRDEFGRDSALIALGGGVVGDLAGFVAATYMRGIPLIQAPTTLLAMVDASVGGKTGVDTPAGKNLVGVVRQPALVAIDPEVLRTLPTDQLRAGLAEAVKHGAIADADYLDWIEAQADLLLAADSAALSELIARSVEIKASFAARDPDERGPRKALNFGHTVAHAIETLSGYALSHGAAVAVGMVAEAGLGEMAGVTAPGTAGRLRHVLEALGLPVRLAGDVVASEAVVAQARRDKKVRRARTRYALLSRIGRVARSADGDWSIDVDEPLVRQALEDAWSV